jgi:cation diffusion facilitator CzcD-associated flavoprotein CzcO
MGRYLSSYAQKFLRPEYFCFNTRVTKMRRADDGKKWVLTWRSVGKDEEETVFDFVVVASGIFSRRDMPAIPGLDSFKGEVIHSSGYRSPDQFADKKVAIVGDSYSATEIAGDLASYASVITHITPRQPWILPKFLPADPRDPASPFIPIDLAIYRRDLRPSPHENILPTAEEITMRHGLLKLFCGNQAEISPQLDVPSDKPLFVSISDEYTGAVRNGRIMVQSRRLATVNGKQLILDNGAAIDDQDVLILATGFHASLDFFPLDLQEAICLDTSDRILPYLLHRNVWHPSLPGVAFVGMYRGPFMGVINLQAIWAAAVFSGRIPSPPVETQLEGIERERRIRDHRPRLQMPHADYVGLMHDLGKEIGVNERVDSATVTIPAQYGETNESAVMRRDLDLDLEASKSGKWMAAAVFTALQGPWRISRRLESALRIYPSGNFTGTASFVPSPRKPLEYVYSEEGQLLTESGLRLEARRSYKYCYNEDEDRIDVYFNDSRDSGFFHSLRFVHPNDPEASSLSTQTLFPGEVVGKGWRAIGDHLCVNDFYDAVYIFPFAGIQLREFRITFKVKGPQKDYIATAKYER